MTSGADDECIDDHRARERGRGSGAQASVKPADHRHIQEHHGTSLVRYFYQRAFQQHEDALAGGKIMRFREDDVPEVHEESFRYSGPKPQTKESAIVSLADAIESASRSVEKPTPQKIETLVNEIVEERISDRQLDEAIFPSAN